MWLTHYSQLKWRYMTISHIFRAQNNILTKNDYNKHRAAVLIPSISSFHEDDQTISKIKKKFLYALKSNSIYWTLKRIWSVMTAIRLYLGEYGSGAKNSLWNK